MTAQAVGPPDISPALPYVLSWLKLANRSWLLPASPLWLAKFMSSAPWTYKVPVEISATGVELVLWKEPEVLSFNGPSLFLSPVVVIVVVYHRAEVRPLRMLRRRSVLALKSQNSYDRNTVKMLSRMGYNNESPFVLCIVSLGERQTVPVTF